jgi:hypothetical protein
MGAFKQGIMISFVISRITLDALWSGDNINVSRECRLLKDIAIFCAGKLGLRQCSRNKINP